MPDMLPFVPRKLGGGPLSYLHVQNLAMFAASGKNLRVTHPQAIVSVNGDAQVCVCLSSELAHRSPLFYEKRNSCP